MVYVPGGLSFPTGVDDDDNATVDGAYWIADTEVTYELWQKVYDWAVNGTGNATGEGDYTLSIRVPRETVPAIPKITR